MALARRSPQASLSRRQAAAKCVTGRFGEGGIGLDAEERGEVLGGGGDASARFKKQCQPFDFLAGDAAFMWQSGDEQVQRLGCKAKALGGQCFASEAGEIAGLVLV